MPVERPTRAAWLIWIIGVGMYVAAVFHRSSLGVAGLEAAQRFGVGPAALGVFTVLQVAVYAVMQVPTGLMVDQYGPRRMLVAAGLLLGLGQVLFGAAHSYPLGLIARAVLGCGDAMTWVSLLRLVAAHFPVRRYAMLVSFSSAVGATGNLVATIPLTLLLGSVGWTLTFAAVGVVTLLLAVLAGTRLRDVPAGSPVPVREPIPLRVVARQVAAAWRVPGTRLGFWVHFSTMFAPAVLGLAWGFPYLVQAQGMSPQAASAVLGVLVVTTMVASPVLGAIVVRRPEHRMPLVAGYLAMAVVLWAVLLGWPGGRLPGAVLAVIFALLSLGGPASTIGFALARDYNPFRRVGTATGVVNVGGFTAITISALAVGVLLDLTSAFGPTQSFRIALLAVVGALLVGVWRTAVWWRRARAAVFAASARGEEVPVRLRLHRWDRLPRPEAARRPATVAA